MPAPRNPPEQLYLFRQVTPVDGRSAAAFCPGPALREGHGVSFNPVHNPCRPPDMNACWSSRLLASTSPQSGRARAIAARAPPL
ncbi:hypothetical protein EMIT048CA2_80185 [Pseudomonas chlororaphis]